MIFVFNKEKICAYIVSFLTVVALFCVSKSIEPKTPDTNTVQTSSNIVNNTNSLENNNNTISTNSVNNTKN